MADRYLLEASAVDGFLLEDGSGVLLLEPTPQVTEGLPRLMLFGGLCLPLHLLPILMLALWMAL